MNCRFSTVLLVVAAMAPAHAFGSIVDDFSYRDPTVWPQVVTTYRTENGAGTYEYDSRILGGARRAYLYPRYTSTAFSVSADILATGDGGVLGVTSSGAGAPGLQLGWGNAAGSETGLGIPKDAAAFVHVEVRSFDAPGGWPLHVQPTVYTSRVSNPLPEVLVWSADRVSIDIPLEPYWTAYPDRVTLDGIGLRLFAGDDASFQVAQVSVEVPEPGILCPLGGMLGVIWALSRQRRR